VVNPDAIFPASAQCRVDEKGLVMSWNTAIKWIMLVSGVLTCTMLFAAVAPQAALRATFGDTLEGPLSEIVVRNWGVLIGLIGAMLIYGAYDPPARPLILIVAGISKLVFISLILAYGRQYLGKAGLAVGIDLMWVVLYVAYLVGTRGRVRGTVAASA
jgi:hypothetical protein